MNPLMACAGVLMFGAAIYEALRGGMKMAIVYGCYAIANFVLGSIKA